MGRKSKFSKELKLSIVKRYLNGEGSTDYFSRSAPLIHSLSTIPKTSIHTTSTIYMHD